MKPNSHILHRRQTSNPIIIPNLIMRRRKPHTQLQPRLRVRRRTARLAARGARRVIAREDVHGEAEAPVINARIPASQVRVDGHINF